MSQHVDYKFSITIHSDELSVISSMRGLSEHCQFSGNKRVPWANTKERDWARDGHKVTFHFNQQNYRDNFETEAKRIFKEGIWSIQDRSNNNPGRRAEP